VTTTPSFSALEEEVRRMVTARVRSQLIREVATNQKHVFLFFALVSDTCSTVVLLAKLQIIEHTGYLY
jgi:hypothetical protein